MKKILRKVSKLLDYIYGWGIFVCLFGGGLMFFGYLAAFIIGGETAAIICEVIYKQIYGVLIYGGNIIVLLGLVNMYLKKQKALTISNDNNEVG